MAVPGAVQRLRLVRHDAIDGTHFQHSSTQRSGVLGLRLRH